MVASNRWHKMNNTICEIERTTEKCGAAIAHCATHKNSVVKAQVVALQEKRDALYRDLMKQNAEWREALCQA